ncbi:MAG: FtsX-like permease family protein [Nitrososphaerota archaeon]
MAKDFLRVRWRTFLIILTSTIIYAAGLTFFSLIISGSALILFSLIVACNVAISAASNIYKRRDEILSLVSVGLNPDHLALLVLAEFLITSFLGGGIGYSMGMYILILSQLPVSPMAIISSAGLMATVMVATTAIMLLASIPHAIKISMLVTPSIKKRWWKGEPVFVGWPPTLSFKVPIKVTEENVVEFFNALLNYITSLKYSTDVSLERIEDVKTVTLKEDFFQLQFTYIYNEVGMPSLTTENEVKILRETDSGKFIVEVTIKVLKHQGFGESLYGFLERMASAYRRAAFEIVSSYKYESGEGGVNERESFIL